MVQKERAGGHSGGEFDAGQIDRDRLCGRLAEKDL